MNKILELKIDLKGIFDNLATGNLTHTSRSCGDIICLTTRALSRLKIISYFMLAALCCGFLCLINPGIVESAVIAFAFERELITRSRSSSLARFWTQIEEGAERKYND